MQNAVREGNTPPPRRSPPQVWHVPMHRNPHFAGRDTLLADVRKALLAAHSVTLVGAQPMPEGVGTTQTALEYVYRFAEQYRIVLWIRARRPATLAAAYASLASVLGLAEKTSGDQCAQIQAVRRWLDRDDGWILVLDDLNVSQGLERFLPDTLRGHVLATSTASHEIPGASPLLVEPFPLQDATAFLRKRSRRVDAELAEQLATQLGRMPLALDLAGAYLAEAQVPLGDLLRMVSERLPEAVGNAEESVDVRRFVAALMGITLERIAVENPVVLDLLALCAFLGPAEIHCALLRDGAAHLLPRLSKTVGQEGMLEKTLETLVRYGLAHNTSEGLSVHPLIQTITSQALNEDQRKAWAEAALRVVAGAFPVESHYDHVIPACTRLLPHVFAATDSAEKLGVAKEETGILLNHAGLYLRACREFEEARDCYRRAVDLGTDVFGNDHSTVATRVNNLGVVLQEMGEFEQARSCYERAAAICEAVHGSTHETVTKPLRNLCHLLEAVGNFDEAREAYRRIITIFVELGGWNHPTVPECFNSLGIMFHNQKRLFNARECFERAIAAEENGKTPRKEHLAHYLNNLGTVLLDEGRARRAQKRFERALAIEREAYAHKHEDIARTLTYLGHALRSQKKYAEARKCLEEALSLQEGDGHGVDYQASRTLLQLGKTLRSLGESAKARDCLERLLALDEARLAPDAPAIARDLIDLGRVHEDLESYDDALRCYERALQIEETKLGGQHQHAATLLTFVGRVLQRQGKPREALEHLQRALVIDTTVSGKNAPSAARDALHIGSILTDMGDNAGALGHLMRALEIYESSLGGDHPKTREVRDRLEALSSQTQ